MIVQQPATSAVIEKWRNGVGRSTRADRLGREVVAAAAAVFTDP